MGPIALFDKSFLQSLSVDEAMWFDHFFMPVICPLFYVETLADLEKAVRQGRTPEQEVGIIASKFPEGSGNPCGYHTTYITGALLGYDVPMDGRILRTDGKWVMRDGRKGVIYDDSPEAQAFSRWQTGRFLEIERDMAKSWRATLSDIDLGNIARHVRALGVGRALCGSLGDARAMANAIVSGSDKSHLQMQLVMELFTIPRHIEQEVAERWNISGYPPLARYAPYVAHALSVELFLQFALAANHIGTAQASNRVDIAYLNYLPFCNIFISTDRLHERCSPFFVRSDQEFVRGEDLKQDLARINAHFMALPENDKEKGIMAFAHAPPNFEGSIVRRLRAKYMGAHFDDQEPIIPPVKGHPASEQLVEEMQEWETAQTAPESKAEDKSDEPAMVAIKRSLHKRRGSWWQLPRNLPIEPPTTTRNEQ